MLKALRYFGWPLLTGVLVALLIIQRFPQWVGLPSQDVNLQQAPQTSRIVQGPVSYADAVTLAAPAVANLYTTKVVNKSAHPLFEDPQFRRFFGDNLPKQRRWESSLGSAVIMSPEGYLLTNNHVTSGADQIVVALKDGRETLARVIGSDPETDLAVLKIDLKKLPAITIGRSDNIHIGDVSLAIGNPFGVGQTVTMGIISATGRNQLGLNNYEDFIQTDAAINPGNSGGAGRRQRQPDRHQHRDLLQVRRLPRHRLRHPGQAGAGGDEIDRRAWPGHSWLAGHRGAAAEPGAGRVLWHAGSSRHRRGGHLPRWSGPTCRSATGRRDHEHQRRTCRRWSQVDEPGGADQAQREDHHRSDAQRATAQADRRGGAATATCAGRRPRSNKRAALQPWRKLAPSSQSGEPA